MSGYDKYGNYVNDEGVTIKITQDKNGKDHISFMMDLLMETILRFMLMWITAVVEAGLLRPMVRDTAIRIPDLVDAF